MILLKKLIFAPFLIILFSLLIYNLVPFLKSYDLIFSLSINTFISLLILSALVSFTSFVFVLFSTLASDWKIVLAVGIINSAIPLLFIDPALGIVLFVLLFVSFLLTNLNLDNTLKSYLTFKPEALLGPLIRHLSGLLILSFCIVYFLSMNKLIAQTGFQIPNSLVGTAIKMAPLPETNTQTEANLPQISQEQLDLLKKNPELVRQSGFDPQILENLTTQKVTQAPADLMEETIKQTVKDQVQGFIKPYQNFIPAGLAIMLFLTLQSLTSILNLLIYPLLWIIFFLLEKIGFIKFEIEQRPVKKLVV